MKVEKIILRFRDLSTNPGDTIKHHRTKIKDHSYTWWGWWCKAGETVPGETFRNLTTIIDRQGPLDIFLLDTGTQTLYPAKLAQIHWDPNYKDVEPPDTDWQATPEYYKGRQVKTWYKLTEIGDGSKDERTLQKWSYVDVDELFETKKSIYKDFDGKQVSSIEELRYQERTIWFLRPFQKGDPTHKILLYDRSKVKPSNFPENIIESHSSCLLWLSDLHFSQDEFHGFPFKEELQGGNKLSEAIRKDLEAQGIKKVGGIIITGDLTWKASKEEFSLVKSFLKDIMSWSTLTPSQVILCPGNHDIAFSKKPWKKDEPVKEAPEKAKKNFEAFYRDFFSTEPNEHLASGKRFLLSGKYVVELVGLNSSALRQTENVFQGHGFVGLKQLSLVSEEMNWKEPEDDNTAAWDVPKPFRIVLLHHHLVPVLPYEDAKYGHHPSLVYDAGSLLNWITTNRVDLALHGHMHHTKVVKETRSLKLQKDNTLWHEYTIASLGSTGVSLNHNELDRANVYGLLEFSNKEIQLRVREIYPRPKDQSNVATIVELELPYE